MLVAIRHHIFFLREVGDVQHLLFLHNGLVETTSDVVVGHEPLACAPRPAVVALELNEDILKIPIRVWHNFVRLGFVVPLQATRRRPPSEGSLEPGLPHLGGLIELARAWRDFLAFGRRR